MELLMELVKLVLNRKLFFLSLFFVFEDPPDSRISQDYTIALLNSVLA